MSKYCDAFVCDALARPDYVFVWLHKGFGLSGAWTVCEQNRLLALCFGLLQVNEV
jgi:hypothetical protein